MSLPAVVRSGLAYGRRLLRVLIIPLLLAAVVTASAPSFLTHTIRRGDNLTEIAQRYHTTVDQLIELNDLPGNGHLIYAGETLKIRQQAPSSTPAGIKIVRHRVVPGDTLIGIGKRYRVNPQSIARHNKLRKPGLIRIGQTLSIPVPKQANSSAGRTYPPAVVAAAASNRTKLARTQQPSREQIRAMIVRTARSFKVDPALALAVAWQESGWDQRKVSLANAIGAMQVLPSTGKWVSGTINQDLDLLKAQDNIIAGVAFLRTLTNDTPLDKAIAGYYQGPGSVRRDGMRPDTERYVKNVLALRERLHRDLSSVPR